MSLADFKPLRDGLVVKVINHRSATGSLIIPTDPSRMRADHDCWGSRLKVRWAEVIAVGPGERNKKGKLIPSKVKAGDLVSFAGMTKSEEPPFVLIQEGSILVIEAATGIRPLDGRLLVKCIEQGDISKGGLFIPDTGKEKPQMGQVIAAGNGEVKAGDVILFHKTVGAEIGLDGKEYLVMREDEVFCTIKVNKKALNVAA